MNEFDRPVSSHMVAPVQTLLHTERLTRAAQVMAELGVSALPIVDASGRLAGVLARSDLLRAARLQHQAAEGEPRWWWPDLRVSEYMQTAVPTSPPTQPLRLCAQRMLDRCLTHVYVLAGSDPAGVISTRELLRAVARAGIDTPLRELSTGCAEPISAAAPLSLASARFVAGSGPPLVVLGDASPVGVFGHAELRACLEADPGVATSVFMDERVLVLPADLPAHHAAEQAIAARARYIIAHDPPHGYRVLSGSSFAACVAGRAPLPTLPQAAVTLADSEFRAAPIEVPDRAPSPSRAVPSSDATEPRREEPRRGPPASEPGGPPEPGPRNRE